MEDSLITVKEVADYLKLKEQTVYLLARQNKIPSLKVGGSLRFKKSQIDAWLATTPKTGAHETRQRVLIVDDEEMVREALKRMVEAHDIQTVAVSSGAQALKAAQEESFRMVFLDLSMPGDEWSRDPEGVEGNRQGSRLRRRHRPNRRRRPIP